MTRRTAPTATIALLVALLTGCGVPTEATPRRLKPTASPSRTAPPTAPSTGSAVAQLCLVKDDRLVRVERRTSTVPTVQNHLQHLLDGPTEAESNDGLTSALTGTNVVAGIELAGGTATVEVENSLEGPSRSDVLFAYGQIVCTLDSRLDVNGVLFVQRGQRLRIPRADGSLSEGPFTIADYADLMSDP